MSKDLSYLFVESTRRPLSFIQNLKYLASFCYAVKRTFSTHFSTTVVLRLLEAAVTVDEAYESPNVESK